MVQMCVNTAVVVAAAAAAAIAAENNFRQAIAEIIIIPSVKLELIDGLTNSI